jgi:hypothetical protein
MKPHHLLLPALLALYGLLYAPYGINETDGGFLRGLAWQVLQGKVLYRDALYVRPPLPVWLQAGYQYLVPGDFSVLGERWLFYAKVMLYCWWGAGVLWTDRTRVWMAAIAFVVSAHNYPAASWHTVDGLLFAALGFYALFRGRSAAALWLAGASTCAAAACKQSFYPLVPLFLLLLPLLPGADPRKTFLHGLGGLLVAAAALTAVLATQGALPGFLAMTTAASSSGQALQHGLLDYLRIQPLVGIPIALLAIIYRTSRHAAFLWAAMLWLCATFLYQVYSTQAFAAPFAQSRVLFWAALLAILWRLPGREPVLAPVSMLAVAWCASMSWGYNLPILFAVPLVWGAVALPGVRYPDAPSCRWAALAALLLVFGLSHQYVYRDGARTQMSAHLGDIFPALRGIWSTPQKAALYADLQALGRRYGPHIAVLPAFPQADMLLSQRPLLGIDWVVTREMGGQEQRVLRDLTAPGVVVLLERSWAARIATDPELALIRRLLEHSTPIAETPFFTAYQWRGPAHE